MKHKPIIYGVSSFLGTVLASKITKSVLPKDKNLESNLILASSAGIAAYISSRKASEYSTAINLGLTAGVVTSVLMSRDRKSIGEEDFSGEVIDDVNVEKINAEDSLPFVPGEIIWEGMPQEINTGGLFNMVNFIEDPTYDLKPYGDFAERRDRPIKRFIIHHGGYNLNSLTAAFKDPTRTASSHFGIELQPDGTVNVAQFMDLNKIAYHAKGFNTNSIGVDIALNPEPRSASRYNLPIIEVDSPRMPGQKALDLPDNLVKALIQLLSELHRVTGLNMVIEPDREAIFSEEELDQTNSTVFGHHHVQASKWDIIYVWNKLLELSKVRPNS